MTTDPFSGPASGNAVQLVQMKEHLGDLLLFTVHEVLRDITTASGVTDAIRADVVVLDGPDVGQTYPDGLVFGRVLQGQLRPRLGGMVLGRLGQGEEKPGKSAPWKLIDPTEKEKDVAREWLAKNPEDPPF